MYRGRLININGVTSTEIWRERMVVNRKNGMIFRGRVICRYKLDIK